MASKKKLTKAQTEELKPNFIDEFGQEDERDYDAIADEMRQEVVRAADDLYEAGQDYLEAHSDEAVVDVTTEIETTKSSFDAPEEMTIIPSKGKAYGMVDFGKAKRHEPKFIYNRLASVEGYQGFGVSYRKAWEIEMALKALHDLGGAHPNANILGVGAGTERTIFELANAQSAALVTATDIYNDPGVWADWHGKKFLKNPHAFAPDGLPYDRERVVALHADMCKLPAEWEEGYDAVFSSGSIEHVGKPGIFDTVAIMAAAREIGRVLKKGGIASISTEFKVSGDGWGFGHVRLFSKEDILKYIVEPSGLELVGDVDWEYHGDLNDYVELADAVNNPKAEEMKPLLRHGGFLFTSIHVVLRKGK